MSNIEKYRFVTYDNDLDYIYLDNPSPMFLVRTEEKFQNLLGKENIEYYQLGGFLGSFGNSFKVKKNKFETFRKEIFKDLVKDDKGYFFEKEALVYEI